MLSKKQTIIMIVRTIMGMISEGKDSEKIEIRKFKKGEINRKVCIRLEGEYEDYMYETIIKFKNKGEDYYCYICNERNEIMLYKKKEILKERIEGIFIEPVEQIMEETDGKIEGIEIPRNISYCYDKVEICSYVSMYCIIEDYKEEKTLKSYPYINEINLEGKKGEIELKELNKRLGYKMAYELTSTIRNCEDIEEYGICKVINPYKFIIKYCDKYYWIHGKYYYKK